MHFEVRILSERLDGDECSALTKGETCFRATIIAVAPGAFEERTQFRGIGPAPDCGPQVEPSGRVQAQVPETVRGKPTPVA